MASKKFLDSDGLDSLWSKICTIFAPKWIAYKPNTSLGKKADSLTITFTSGDSTKGADITIDIPAATTTAAGLLTPTEKNQLANLEANLSSNEKYVSTISPDTTATPVAVGGIAKGTTVKQLNDLNYTYSQMFDALLFPTVVPTFTAPSASMTYSGSKMVKVGTAVPSKDKFTGSLNRGAITLNGVRQDYRAGAENTSKSYKYHSSDTTGATWPTKINLGANSFYYKAFYAQGPQPKDNKGGNYSTPLAAGSVVSGACTIYGTYPIFATTSNIGEYTEQAILVEWKTNAKYGRFNTGDASIILVTQPELTSGSPTYSNRQGFLVPNPAGKPTTVKIEWYNTGSGQWDNHTDQFTSTEDITKSINGNNVNYKYYYYDSMTGKGDREFRITITF